MITPWSAGSVAPKTKMKHPQPHYSRNLALRILRQSFAAGGWDGMDMCSVPRPVSNLSQIYRFPAPEGKVGLERHGLNMSVLISGYVACLALTYKTEMHGELVLDIVWCCQSHSMGHGERPNLKWIWWMMMMISPPPKQNQDDFFSSRLSNRFVLVFSLWCFLAIVYKSI